VQQICTACPNATSAVLAAVAITVPGATESLKSLAAGRLPDCQLLLAWQSPGLQHASLEWRVADFLQQEGELLSPPLTLAGGSASRFKLWLHPAGNAATDSNAAGHVSLFLEADIQAGSGINLMVKYKLQLVDHVGFHSHAQVNYACSRQSARSFLVPAGRCNFLTGV